MPGDRTRVRYNGKEGLRNVGHSNHEHQAPDQLDCIDGNYRLGFIRAPASSRFYGGAVISGSHQICVGFPLAAAIDCIFGHSHNAAPVEPGA